MATKRGGIERVLAKCRASIDDGKYYEAHQMYRTLYFRYNAQKKYTEAIDLLYNGAMTLLKFNQHSSGTDLALLLLEVLQASQAEVNDSSLDKIATVYSMIDEENVDRPRYVSTAIRWSQNGQTHKYGHPKLHQRFAITLWREKNYSQSRYHFIHSQDGSGCASMLVEYHVSTGFPSEVDLFIAQAVLQYLCLSNKRTAEEAFSSYTQQHPAVEQGPPFIRPLLNFLWLLLLAVESGKVAVFTILCEQYQPSLKRDPSYNEYLDRIGQLFFGLPPPKAAAPGFLGNLLQSLFNADEEDSDDESPQVAHPAQPHPAPPQMTHEDLD